MGKKGLSNTLIEIYVDCLSVKLQDLYDRDSIKYCLL